MITEERLKRLVYDSTYRKGVEFQKRVCWLETKERKEKNCVEAKVLGNQGRSFAVEIAMDTEWNKILEAHCTCLSFSAYGGLCKHCVAVLLELIQRNKPKPEQKEIDSMKITEELQRLFAMAGIQKGMQDNMPIRPGNEGLRSSPGLEKLLRGFQEELESDPFKEVIGEVELVPRLNVMGQQAELSLKIGITQKYVLKDIPSFVNRVEGHGSYYYGKKLEFIHSDEAFTDQSKPLLQFVKKLGRRGSGNQQLYRYGYYSAAAKEDVLRIDKAHMDELMHILEGLEFEGIFMGNMSSTWRIQDGMPSFDAVLRPKKDGAVFTMRSYIKLEGEDYFYFPREGKIIRMKKSQFGKSLGFFSLLQEYNRAECDISKKDLPVFLEEILPDLQNVMPVDIRLTDVEKFLPMTPDFRFYLDMPQRNMITCKGYALYGEAKIPLWEPVPPGRLESFRRNRKAEKLAERSAAGLFQAYDPATLEMVLEGEEACYDFLTDGMEKLKEVGQVYVTDALKSVQIRTLPQIHVGVSLSGDLLNLTLESELPMEQLAELLSRYDRKKKYYRLKNGEFIQYDQESVNTVGEILKGLQVSEKNIRSGSVAVQRYRALYLDESLKGQNGLVVEKERSYRSLIRNMKTVEDSDFEIPPSLKHVLREYQKKGFLWLKTLEKSGFGGILADDMGLGKTLQVIAFLLSSKEEAGEGELQRSLIVSPASLVYNWENEIHRFAPELKVKVLAGGAQERKILLKEVGTDEVLVTSYDLLKRDVELYQEIPFFCQVIDEAQYIKNAGTKGAQAVKQISARVKLALTGTPVENRLSELWSIFDYLMPGFLYSYTRFKEVFENPIVKYQDEEAMTRLRRMIQPFVLRRLKRDVLSDLPDKIEKNTYIRMEGEQKELYQAHVQRLKLLLEESSDDGFSSIRMKVLSELTRLRQLCCDPSLIYENYQGSSAKVDLCLELLKNAVEGGHKILLFSQFTSMLDILKKRMEAEKIRFYSLTGETPKKERQELMNAFNEDDTSVFCISLKAGGTGLNLTGADMVIHYDPWWNLAAETQATDRAHRIGQKKVVTVYKLVAEGTIEEKVVELQQKKKELADQLLSGEEMASIQINREELLKLFETES